jgi:DNA-binding GntR family transcriptional regulator
MTRTMGFPSVSSLNSIKGNIAGILREEIISGRLSPGERIAEDRWAAKLRVAKTSLREALNILAVEGFVRKEPNRGAHVTVLSETDAVRIYEVRTSLESLAARLVATSQPDFSELDQTLADMFSAVQSGSTRIYHERDLSFHLLLCEKSGNPFLLDSVRRLIVPLFAFVVLRRHGARADPEQWAKSYEEHRRILNALRSGDPDFAEREVATIIKFFSEQTVDFLREQRESGMCKD